MLELTPIWAETMGEPDICIAVLDGPVDQSHPCFARAQLTRLETLVSGAAAQGVASQHGTHVASLIWGYHGSSVRGIAPGCRGLIVPVFAEGKHGELVPCSQIDLARAITQAVEQGAHVINISSGELTPSGEPHASLARAVRLCADNGVLIVAAAGNDGCQCLNVPAAVPSVLAVGAIDAQGAPLASSNWGPLYQIQGILAPGENILGAAPGGGVAIRSGTSFATAIVSGIVGLLLSIQLKRGDKPDPHAVRVAILKSAHPCNPQEASDCRRFMVGSLNVAGAYRLITEGRENGLGATARVQGAEKVVSGPPASRMMTPTAAKAAAPVELYALTKKQEGYGSDQQQTVDIRPQDGAGVMPGGTTRQHSALSKARTFHAVSQQYNFVFRDTALMVTPSEVHPTDCGCGCGESPPLVYALGAIGYDLGTEARRDALIQAMPGERNDPGDAGQLLAYLATNPYEAAWVIWTLNVDATPIYAIRPAGPYASVAYERLREFLSAQVTGEVVMVAVPGILAGSATLLSGQTVPQIVPELLGMASWSIPALVNAVLGVRPAEAALAAAHDERRAGLTNYLDRIYYEMRNLGLSSQERAKNFTATNLYQVGQAFTQAATEGMQLDSITVERSLICRPHSDCWDVILTFFNPARRLEQAWRAFRLTVDVSEVMPVTVGVVRSWYVY